jgi:hypothetical protein
VGQLGAVAVAPLLLAAVGCGAESQGGTAGGSCPLAFAYRSQTYYAYKTEKPVEPGRPFGEVRYPRCDDFGGQAIDEPALDEDAAARFRAYTIAGVDPADAFVVPSEHRHYLFFSGSSDGTAMPPEVRRLLNH